MYIYIYIYIYISHVNVTQTVPDISPLMPMHQDPLLVWHMFVNQELEPDRCLLVSYSKFGFSGYNRIMYIAVDFF